jgi:hypothetical protein
MGTATQPRSILGEARVTGFVEPASQGDWTISTFNADDNELASMMMQMKSGRGRLREGETYTRLDYRNGVVMSDTPDELRDCMPILLHGTGRVLVNGLGLGCVLKGLLAKAEVEHIDVVEIDPDVIALTGHYFEGDRCTIHEGDAFTFDWPKGTRWDAVWHDVWPDLCVDNLSDEHDANPGTYAKLHRRFGRRCDWQGSWGFEWLKAVRDRGGWR